MAKVKAVIFDLGGVVVGSPIQGTYIYEKANNLPHNYVNVSILHRGTSGSFQRLERGEMELEKFFEEFEKELNDSSNLNFYQQYLQSRGKEIPNLPKEIQINGKELFVTMMKHATEPDPQMIGAIKILKEKGFQVIALTNNFVIPEEFKTTVGAPPSEFLQIFDEVIESSVVGLRKPDPRFFQYALDKIKCKPSETVFLDDIGLNVKAASKMGIKTIKVNIGRGTEALKELELIVGCPLLNRSKI